MWSEDQIKIHRETGRKLYAILEQALSFIKNHNNCTEYEVSQYILAQFEANELHSDSDPPIVAFRENTSFVHYYPKKKLSKKLTKNSLILIDLWASQKQRNAPFADITWMAYYGKDIPNEYKNAFNLVAKARDLTIEYIRDELKNSRLPQGKMTDHIARNYFKQNKVADNFLHSTGHSIGTLSPHGKFGHLRRTNINLLRENLGYTIEPGLYFKDRFGIRSELDFYFVGKEMFITTPIQKEITRI